MWFEIIGYLASALIAISLMMNSIIKLRSFGLIGALLFSAYGFIIGAYPVGILNLLNSGIHIFYLYKIRHRKDFFRILELRPENKYLVYFLQFNNEKIKKFFPDFEFNLPNENYLTFFVVRNLTVAGVVVSEKTKDNELNILLDYVIPEYRDFKIGDYVYHESKTFFTDKNLFCVNCKSTNKRHIKYIEKMGFVLNNAKGENVYTLVLKNNQLL